jgi:nucleoside-diphosphate-sugar epimerase
MNRLRQYQVAETQSIKEAMAVTDRNGLQMCFVVGKKGRLSGCVSDGDIRRAILKGIDIGRPVAEIMNQQPIVLKENQCQDPSLIRRWVSRLTGLLHGARVIPVVNEAGRFTDLLSCNDLRRFDPSRREKLTSVRRVLVVGGGGYLGSAVTRHLLEKGFDVRVLDIFLFGQSPLRAFEKNKKLEIVNGDVRNIATVASSLRGMEAVINLAALVGDPACRQRPEDALITNYLANKALAEACKYLQINRFIYASTCSVYGAGKGLLDENAPLNPVSLYARSKIASEEAVLKMADGNFSPTIFRMSTLYGLSKRMRYDLVVNRMCMTAFRDHQIILEGGGQWRPLVHVDDAAEAYVLALRAPLQHVQGEVFNVGVEFQNYRIEEIAPIIKGVFPQAHIIRKPSDVDQRDYRVTFAKIKRALGFRTKWTVEMAAKEIRHALMKGKYCDFEKRSYYNADPER